LQVTMQRSFNVAIVGATGAVGRLLLQLLVERDFPVNHLYLLASSRSAGQRIAFKEDTLAVTQLAQFDFKGCDLCFFSAGAAVSLEYASKAVLAGCYVIDNTSAFRREENVPLVIPEVNGEVLAVLTSPCIIANPNCSTIQLLVALNSLYREVGIKRLIVSTYQAVSGAGQKAVDKLLGEQKALLEGGNSHDAQQANNVIPLIDVMQDNGYTREEMKIRWETQKIWQDGAIKVDATAVRVPVINGHAEAVTIETMALIAPERAKALLEAAEGVCVVDDSDATPVGVSGQDQVFVARIRASQVFDNGLNLWVLGDNLRKGAATNSIHIAERLFELPRSVIN
jgi:aspartate-semialdehyde dehydrogenase